MLKVIHEATMTEVVKLPKDHPWFLVQTAVGLLFSSSTSQPPASNIIRPRGPLLYLPGILLWGRRERGRGFYIAVFAQMVRQRGRKETEEERKGDERD